jgi:hypothetical protein
MASVFQVSEGMINVNFLPHGVTVNAQYYSNLLPNVRQAIQRRTLGPIA